MFESYLERHIIIGDIGCRSCGGFVVSHLLAVAVAVAVGIGTDKLESLEPDFQTIAIAAIFRLPLIKLQCPLRESVNLF